MRFLSGILVIVAVGLLVGAIEHDPGGLFGAVTASWVQALGSIGAILAASWIATDQSRQQRQRDDLQRDERAAQEQAIQRDRFDVAIELVASTARGLDGLATTLEQWAEGTQLSLKTAALSYLYRQLERFEIEKLRPLRAYSAFSLVVGLTKLTVDSFQTSDGFSKPPESEAAKESARNLARTLRAQLTLVTGSLAVLQTAREELD